MYFNSWQFAFFFLATYLLYLLVRNFRLQNLLLLFASYYFYAAWNWRFLSLIFISTVVDYICGIELDKTSSAGKRKILVTISILTNLGILGFFKYFNFFVQSMEGMVGSLGLDASSMRLDLILPVGISFYTFQTMSYTLDIYRGEMKSTRNFLDFALFVAFFPQLVAGPIERAKELLPQMSRPRTVTQQAFYSGCWLIFWGLWKKVVVADNLAYLADPVFRGSANASALQAYLGVTAFAGQIYCDFSGYSDIARGLARIMGFDLMRNFNLPYFAANPSDFWRRWHISLSTWLRDYLYIPLGGNRGSPLATYRNLFLTMFLGGLWHGASWNFAWWGIYHGLVLMGCRFISTVRPEWEKYRGGVRHFFNVFATYHVTLVGWLLFRATRRVMAAGGQMRDDGVRQILEMIGAWQNGLGFNATSLEMLKTLCFISLPLFIVQWLQHHTRDHYIMLRWRAPARIAFFAYLGWMWLLYGVQQGNAFIYFQF